MEHVKGKKQNRLHIKLRVLKISTLNTIFIRHNWQLAFFLQAIITSEQAITYGRESFENDSNDLQKMLQSSML